MVEVLLGMVKTLRDEKIAATRGGEQQQSVSAVGGVNVADATVARRDESNVSPPKELVTTLRQRVSVDEFMTILQVQFIMQKEAH